MGLLLSPSIKLLDLSKGKGKGRGSKQVVFVRPESNRARAFFISKLLQNRFIKVASGKVDNFTRIVEASGIQFHMSGKKWEYQKSCS